MKLLQKKFYTTENRIKSAYVRREQTIERKHFLAGRRDILNARNARVPSLRGDRLALFSLQDFILEEPYLIHLKHTSTKKKCVCPPSLVSGKLKEILRCKKNFTSSAKQNDFPRLFTRREKALKVLRVNGFMRYKPWIF